MLPTSSSSGRVESPLASRLLKVRPLPLLVPYARFVLYACFGFCGVKIVSATKRQHNVIVCLFKTSLFFALFPRVASHSAINSFIHPSFHVDCSQSEASHIQFLVYSSRFLLTFILLAFLHYQNKSLKHKLRPPTTMLLSTALATLAIASSAFAAALANTDNLITAEQIPAIMPTSATCKNLEECRTAEQAAPWVSKSFINYRISTKAEQAALLGIMAYESVEFEFNTNLAQNIGQGTRNMQSGRFNVAYAQSMP